MRFFSCHSISPALWLAGHQQPRKEILMANRKQQAAKGQADSATIAPQTDEQPSTESQQKPGDKLNQAEAELQRMQETHRLCFRFQNNLDKLAEELRHRKYSDRDIIYLLEPKGDRKIPGYELRDLARQKKFISILQEGPKPASSHVEAVEQSRQLEDELSR
jgi:hypothetical protein